MSREASPTDVASRTAPASVNTAPRLDAADAPFSAAESTHTDVTAAPPIARPARRQHALSRGQWLFYAVPLLWLTCFLLVPFLLVAKISLAEAVAGQPPYTPLITTAADGTQVLAVSLANYRFLIEDPLYLVAWLDSLRIAAIATLLTVLVAYPIALAIARATERTRQLLLVLVMLPFWTSFLLRVYAWKLLLQGSGLVNGTLLALGLIDQPLTLLYTPFAVYLGIIYAYLPFAVLPLYATLVRLDHSLVEAALDLGCRPWQAFLRVTLPLSLPGLLAGGLLVFVPAVGEFVIPELLGGPDAVMIGRVLWNEFFANRDWPLAAAVAVAMLLVLVLPLALLQNATAGDAADAAMPPGGR